MEEGKRIGAGTGRAGRCLIAREFPIFKVVVPLSIPSKRSVQKPVRFGSNVEGPAGRRGALPNIKDGMSLRCMRAYVNTRASLDGLVNRVDPRFRFDELRVP